MYGDSTMETHITICKIESQGEVAVCLRELKPGLRAQSQPRGVGWGERWEGGSSERRHE